MAIAIPNPVHYKGLTLRPALPMDETLAAASVAMDPWHEWARELPFYWVKQRENCLSLLLEDRDGPVLFLQLITLNPEEMELMIQFAPINTRTMRARAMTALCTGWEGLAKNLSACGVKAVYFASKNPEMIRFLQERIGLVPDGERYKIDVQPVEAIA